MYAVDDRCASEPPEVVGDSFNGPFDQIQIDSRQSDAVYSPQQLLISILSSVLLSIPLGFCVGVFLVRRYGRFASNRSHCDDEHERMCQSLPVGALSLTNQKYGTKSNTHLVPGQTTIPPPLPANHPSQTPSLQSLTMSRVLTLPNSRQSEAYGHILNKSNSQLQRGYAPANPHVVIAGQYTNRKPSLSEFKSQANDSLSNLPKSKKIYL